MNRLPYGSLSPTLNFYKYASQTEVIGSVPLCVIVEDAKNELPVYDNIDNDSIYRKIASAQRAVEDFLNKDTTLRERLSLWIAPQRVIDLPYGKHDILEVSQQIVWDGAFIPTTDYTVTGLDYKSIRLHNQYPTKVSYNSGSETVDDIFKEAVLQETSFYFKHRNDPNATSAETINGLSKVTMNLLSNYRR